MGILSAIKKGAEKVLNTATVALAHPIKTAYAAVSPKATINEVIESHFSQPLSTQITQTILGTAGIATTIAGGAAISSAVKAKGVLSVAAKLIPATTKGKVVAAVATPIVTGAVVSQPKKAFEIATSAPGELAQFGSDVGNLIADPSLKTGTQVIKESPIISGLLGAVALGGIIKGVAPLVSGAILTHETKKQTEILEEIGAGSTSKNPPDVIYTSTPIYAADGSAAAPAAAAAAPQTAQTKTLTTPKKTGGKRKKQAIHPSINQRVNVIVSTRSSSIGINKKYLRERIFN